MPPNARNVDSLQEYYDQRPVTVTDWDGNVVGSARVVVRRNVDPMTRSYLALRGGEWIRLLP